jgi:hypothetical protein
MAMMVVVVPVVTMTPVVVAVVMPAPMRFLDVAGCLRLCGLEGLRQSRGRGSLRSRSHCRPSQQHGCGR